MVGNGWMLVGDAASLIDPFTGEGIGNAMVSGEIAARYTIEASAQRRFDAAFLAGYERDVRSYLGNELRSEERRVGKECRSRWSRGRDERIERVREGGRDGVDRR